MNNLKNFLKNKYTKIGVLAAAVILIICILSFAVPSGNNAEFRSPIPTETEAFLGRWQCDRAGLTVSWTPDDDFTVSVVWSSSAWENTEWRYHCTYDAENCTLVSLPDGTRTEYAHNEDGELASSALVYSDGTASFLLNRDGYLIWQDNKEYAGKGMRFERLP
ncbi:MAG: hypothetical protein IKE15_10035 [Clostridia bacterium]|nr:hypothetical protein [Clostridia bacterium]